MKNDQPRNIKWVLAATLILEALLVGIAIAWYQGDEVPPSEMRQYYALPDGYAPPSSESVVPANTVARGSLSLRRAASWMGNQKTERTTDAEKEATPNASIASLVNALSKNPAMLDLGRQRYEENCAMCHGLPGHGIGIVGQEYTPPAPQLSARVPQRSPEQLFASISTGIRSTPTAETARYLPQEWHAFAPLLPTKERLALVVFMQHAFARPNATASARPISGHSSE